MYRTSTQWDIAAKCQHFDKFIMKFQSDCLEARCVFVCVSEVHTLRKMLSSIVVDRVSSSTFMELLLPHGYSLNLINGLAVTVAHVFTSWNPKLNTHCSLKPLHFHADVRSVVPLSKLPKKCDVPAPCGSRLKHQSAGAINHWGKKTMIFLKLTFNLNYGPPLRPTPQTSKTSGCKLAGSNRPLDMIPAERQLQKYLWVPTRGLHRTYT